MATKQITRNVALTPHWDQFVQSKVESGRYQSVSEVVREGLRLLEEREWQKNHSLDLLKRDIELGWEQSEQNVMLDGPAVFAEIRQLSRAKRAKAR